MEFRRKSVSIQAVDEAQQLILGPTMTRPDLVDEIDDPDRMPTVSTLLRYNVVLEIARGHSCRPADALLPTAEPWQTTIPE